MADLPVSDAVLFPWPGPAAIVVPATVEWAVPLAAAGDRQPANPPLAMGLSGIADWSTEQPFIDVMKSARSWTGHLPGQWGGWTHDDLAAGGWLDAHGWPKAVPGELTEISTIMLSDQPEAAASLAGRYRLTYRGQGRIRIEGRASRVVARAGEIWFEYTPGQGQVVLTIASTDPRKTGDHIRDIEIIKAENIELHAAGAIFNPLWRARVENLRALRFMDWMATNNSTQSEWQDRPRPNDYTYAWRGAPLEVMVALANEIGADPWFTLPHRASDDYMRAFASQVRESLDPRRKVFVEYSNEVWNWIFEQAHWARAQAQTRWGAAAGGDAWMQFAGMRAARMAQIWDAAFGPDGDRLIKVISTQTGWQGLETPLLEAPLWVAEDRERNRPPVQYFDAYGVTGYFGNQLGNEKASAVKEWLAESRAAANAAGEARGLSGATLAAEVATHRFDAALAKAAAELRDGSVTGQDDDSLAALLGEVLPYQADVAREHGLALVMYEGGTHVVGGASWLEDDTLAEFLTHLNYSAEMAELYRELLDGWRDVGGGLFNAFVDVAGASKWGSWGALRHLDDANPRWAALEAFNRQTAAWWEPRPAGSFDDGATIAGGPGADALRGSGQRDILLGREGDDMLVGGGNDDRLHGGAGNDTALLPGVRSEYTLRAGAGVVLAIGRGAETRLVDVEQIGFSEEPAAVVSTVELR